MVKKTDFEERVNNSYSKIGNGLRGLYEKICRRFASNTTESVQGEYLSPEAKVTVRHRAEDFSDKECESIIINFQANMSHPLSERTRKLIEVVGDITIDNDFKKI